MPKLLKMESDALMVAVSLFDQLTFNAFLRRNGGPKLASFSSSLSHMSVIAVDFYNWIETDGRSSPDLLDAMADELAANEVVPVLRAAAKRLRSAAEKAAHIGHPTDVWLADGTPIINRAILRRYLKKAVGDASFPGPDVKVVKVVGDRGLGKTHSWYLINHVADNCNARAIKIDMISATLENQTLSVLFDTLVRVLGITGSQAPTSAGVTTETLAARYADELSGCLERASHSWPKPIWLVFDSLDRDLRPEVKRFVSLLAAKRLDGHFRNCVIFLLGPDAKAEPNDPFRRVHNEPLGAFTDEEIREAATGLNSLGMTPLMHDALQNRITTMQSLSRSHSGGSLYNKICDMFVDLRIEVQA